MQTTLDHIDKLRPDVWTYWLRPDTRLRFMAGQYIELYVPHSEPDQRGEYRWMTISSTPFDELVGITTKFAPHGSTYKKALQLVHPGARLHISDPIGDFVLPKYQPTPVVLIAAGIGITPALSMIVTAQHMHEKRPIQLLHVARTESELLFGKVFDTAPIVYRQLLTQPDSRWRGLRGALTASRILDLAGQAQDALFYFSGPEDMVMQIVRELLRLGIERSHIVLDYFPGYVDL